MSHTITTTLEDGIERVTCTPDARRHDTPLLFVHGMWHGAWCWQGWQTQLADAGWESHAISLPGHAGSPTQRPLRWCTLGYYLGVVRREVERLDRKPVLIGHSMGGALTQHYLKRVGDDLPATVLVAPWPYTNYPWGPLLFLKLDFVGSIMSFLTLSAGPFMRTPARAAAALLGPDPAVSAEWLHGQLNSESFLVMNEHIWPFWDAPKQFKTPMLLLAGEMDAVCPLPWERRTAERYGADLHVVAGAGHNLMHEKSASETVGVMDNWLRARLE
jgi:pimeloyl-ACP methyl ester carboxylesterase